MKLAKLEKISIRNHPNLSEKWVQDIIADDPSILGLGDVVLKDKERLQPRAGRLDLLLQDSESVRRYEVEIQLGRTDESHIIRTIEYWDIERKRYPQYEHTAVIVAEEITSRFLNVISLFNGAIPLVALQMNALAIDDRIGLIFTTVLDQVDLGLVDEDEEVQEATDRAYWEKKGSSETVKMADTLLDLVHEIDPALELKYNKFYVGLAKNGQPNNFVIFRPQKSALLLYIKIAESEEVEHRVEESGLDLVGYDKRARGYRIRLKKKDIAPAGDLLKDLFDRAYADRGGT